MTVPTVTPGQGLRRSASDHNAMAAAANAFAASRSEPGESRRRRHEHDTAIVYNDDGNDWARWDVIRLSDPITLPASDEIGFLRRVDHYGTTPTGDDDAGLCGICLEPIPYGESGSVIVSGVTHAIVEVDDTTHEYAEVDTNGGRRLKSASSGFAQILWKESGTGEKWARLRLSNKPAAGIQAVRFRQYWFDNSNPTLTSFTLLGNGGLGTGIGVAQGAATEFSGTWYEKYTPSAITDKSLSITQAGVYRFDFMHEWYFDSWDSTSPSSSDWQNHTVWYSIFKRAAGASPWSSIGDGMLAGSWAHQLFWGNWTAPMIAEPCQGHAICSVDANDEFRFNLNFFLSGPGSPHSPVINDGGSQLLEIYKLS